MVFSSCGVQKQNKTQEENKIDELYALMQGSYNSSAQAYTDSSYFDISLHMYPIWEKDVQYKWLYVEQAVSARQDKPYRQRVYRLERNQQGEYVSSVFELPDPDASIGKWKTPEFFNQWGPKDLKIRKGCDVVLKRVGDYHFEGSTVGDKCKSSLRGASYATSKVSIKAKKIESWDQGFNDKGEQVWGAEKGGYVFDKLRTRR